MFNPRYNFFFAQLFAHRRTDSCTNTVTTEWLKRDFLLWRDSRLSSGWAAERTSKQWRFSDDIEKTDKILPSVGAVFDSSRYVYHMLATRDTEMATIKKLSLFIA